MKPGGHFTSDTRLNKIVDVYGVHLIYTTRLCCFLFSGTSNPQKCPDQGLVLSRVDDRTTGEYKEISVDGVDNGATECCRWKTMMGKFFEDQ